MIVLVGLMEYMIRRHDADYIDPGAWDFRATAGAVGSRTANREVLGFGDSLLKLSTIPRVIEQNAGMRSFNLAVAGSQTPLSYFLLRRALNSGAEPEAVLLECAPALLRLGPRHNLDNWSHALNLLEAAELAWAAQDSDLFARVSLGCIFGSVQNRLGLRNAIQLALDGQENPKRFETRAFRRNWAECDGAQIMQVNPKLRHFPLDLEHWRLQFYPAWVCHPVNNGFLRRFLDLAAERHLKVYWVIPPILPKLQAACERGGFTAEQDRFLHALVERYPNVVVVDGRRQDYDPAVFLDPNHLGRDGAYTFTVELARILRQTCDPGTPESSLRWVHLPPFVARHVEDNIHDVRQTMAEIESQEASARR